MGLLVVVINSRTASMLLETSDRNNCFAQFRSSDPDPQPWSLQPIDYRFLSDFTSLKDSPLSRTYCQIASQVASIKSKRSWSCIVIWLRINLGGQIWASSFRDPTMLIEKSTWLKDLGSTKKGSFLYAD
jgi:hypothetical protein